jgi:threonine dehydratase
VFPLTRSRLRGAPEFAPGLAPVITPVRALRNHGWRRLLVKDETRQISGAFKYRGCAWRVSALRPGAHLVTASTGNHAAGLAIAAARVGARLTVYVPEATPQAKLDRIADAGGQVIQVDGSYDDCEARAARETAGHQTFVHSFDDPFVIDGHRTLFREVVRQVGPPDVGFVPVGGGGLITAAIAEWAAERTRIVAVEYADAPALRESLAAGRRVRLDSAVGMPEGLLVRRIGALAYEACRRYAVTVETVTDDEIRHAMRTLWTEAGVRVEGAGAAALAAALKVANPSETALCVVSGGNIDRDMWHRWTSLAHDGPHTDDSGSLP